MRNIDQNDLQHTLRDMWDTRPARRRDDRQVAGVAAAIARRYDIDPTLVRIGFVVATVSGGIGAALYIAGWIALPEARDQGGAPATPRRALAVIGLVAGLAITFGWWGDGPSAAPFLTALIVAGLLFLLHRSRTGQPFGGSGAAEAPTVATATADGVSLQKESAVSFEKPGAPVSEPVAVPPSWDPLGAAPFAWDLPEPSPAATPVEPTRRRLPVTAVTLGLALLAGGATAIVLLLGGALIVPNVPVILGVLLATVGAGLVVGAFTHTGRGLIPIALLLSALTWGALSVPQNTWRSGSFGDLDARPLSVAQVQPVYQRSLGDIGVDLSQVDLSVLPGGDASPVRTRVEIGAGDVTVIVPPNADVTLDGTARVGNIQFGDLNQDGTDIHVQGTDLGADGAASGRPLLVDIDMGAGNAEVHRG